MKGVGVLFGNLNRDPKRVSRRKGGAMRLFLTVILAPAVLAIALPAAVNAELKDDELCRYLVSNSPFVVSWHAMSRRSGPMSGKLHLFIDEGCTGGRTVPIVFRGADGPIQNLRISGKKISYTSASGAEHELVYKNESLLKGSFRFPAGHERQGFQGSLEAVPAHK